MLDLVIRNSGSVFGRAVFALSLAAISVLSLVWLSIAVAGWYASMVSPALAAALTGVTFAAIAGLVYLGDRVFRSSADSKPKDTAASPRKTEDLISRATVIAERMAPDSPVVAVIVALLAGIASVSLPAAMSPILNKILDDVEKSPEGRIHN